MRSFFTTIWLNVFSALLYKVFIVGVIAITMYASTSISQTIFTEDWESGIGSWYADNGLWEVGIPTIGPTTTYSGQNCAGTVLDGNYSNGANTRLISPQITLPGLATGEKLKLKFWSWFRMNNNYADYDYGFVQISLDDGNSWETISGNYDEYSEVWTQSYIDISAYTNLAVRIGFNFISSSNDVDNGWYIDDVSVSKGIDIFYNPEDFELGTGDWGADNGLWEVGIPTVGPTTTHSGQNCAGTVLDGNYSNGANTRLISPQITLPGLATGEKLKLKFWSWFRMNNNYADYDYGFVQISLDDGNSWETISGNYDEYSEVWTQSYIDISAYTNLAVRIGFNFISSSNDVDNGWYIDDVSVSKGIDVFYNPEDFEIGTGDWSADNGLWEVGIPTIGPTTTHSGQNCAGTVLDGNYFNSANTRLVSPEVTLTPKPGQSPGLFFWEWHRMDNNYADYDYGVVQISVNGGDWQTISDPFDEYSEVWAQSFVSLSAYKDSTVRIGFNFISSENDVEIGWYIDDIRIEGVEIPTAVNQEIISIPNKFVLKQNYPNPFNPSTKISWQSPVGSWQTLKIYDVLGNEVATLVDEYKPAGSYEIEFGGKDLTSGIYFYKLRAGSFVETKKMVIIR